MSNPPTGTVTFLFTDIEGSTKRWEQYPQQMSAALARHDTILRTAIEGQGGYIFKTMGDAFCAAFSTPSDAVHSALAAQRALNAEQWEWVEQSVEQEQLGPLTVRMGLHTGAAQSQQGDYFGQPLNRVARLLSAGHGGQVLLSMGTYEMVRDNLPAGVQLLDMGEHRLKDLSRPEHIFQLIAPDLPSEFAPLRTLYNRPNNLPMQPTPLIGREQQIEAVHSMLRRPEVRLVTLIGPGGIGKTRLGLQVAADMVDEFEQGIFFVNLAPISNPTLVASTIAQVLGVQESGQKPIVENLKGYLGDQQILLLLDNFEQIVEAASLVADLLAAAPQLKVVVTSREPLGIRGEHHFSVPPLALPNRESLPPIASLTQYEAVRLFIERALAVKADFEVTNENAPAVAEICARLDGLPLPIELAAARTRLFPPQALLARLSSRLKVLTGGARDLPVRQQTLRSTIEWSYDLLHEGEKQLFRRISVFRGGRTMEAMEAVCNADGNLEVDIMDGVQSLVDKSLLAQRDGGDGEPRFWMLETIHEYAGEKLEESGEADTVRREHAQYFLTLVEAAEPELRGPQQGEWLRRLEEEFDNIRAALVWANESRDMETALQLAGRLHRFWSMRGSISEGREAVAKALSLGDDEAKATQTEDRSDHQRTLQALRAKALLVAGDLAWMQGDYAVAGEFSTKCLAAYQQFNDKRGMSHALSLLGLSATMEGNYSLARSFYERSLALMREVGTKVGIAATLNNMGVLAEHQGDYSSARTLCAESLVLQRELGNKQGIAYALIHLGNAALHQGDYLSARARHAESLALLREIGEKRVVPEAFEGLALVSAALDEHARAARLWGAAEALRGSIGVPMYPATVSAYKEAVATASGQMEEEDWKAAWSKGRAMELEDAMAYALEGTGYE